MINDTPALTTNTLELLAFVKEVGKVIVTACSLCEFMVIVVE